MFWSLPGNQRLRSPGVGASWLEMSPIRSSRSRVAVVCLAALLLVEASSLRNLASGSSDNEESSARDDSEPCDGKTGESPFSTISFTFARLAERLSYLAVWQPAVQGHQHRRNSRNALVSFARMVISVRLSAAKIVLSGVDLFICCR